MSNSSNPVQDLSKVVFDPDTAFNRGNGYTLFVIDEFISHVKWGFDCCRMRASMKSLAAKWFQIPQDLKEFYRGQAEIRHSHVYVGCAQEGYANKDLNGVPFRDYKLCSKCLSTLETIAEMSLSEPRAFSYVTYCKLEIKKKKLEQHIMGHRLRRFKDTFLKGFLQSGPHIRD